MMNVEFFPVVMGTVMQWHTDYHGLDTDFKIFTDCAFAVLRVVLLTDYQ